MYLSTQTVLIPVEGTIGLLTRISQSLKVRDEIMCRS